MVACQQSGSVSQTMPGLDGVNDKITDVVAIENKARMVSEVVGINGQLIHPM